MPTEEVAPCGKCGQWIQLRATECRHCGAGLAELRSADAQRDLERDPLGREIQVGVFIAGAGAVLFMVLAFIGQAANRDDLAIVGLSGAVVCIEWLLIRGAIISAIVAARRLR